MEKGSANTSEVSILVKQHVTHPALDDDEMQQFVASLHPAPMSSIVPRYIFFAAFLVSLTF